MELQLLAVSIVVFLCVILNKISGKLGIPTLLAFILLGMFFGSDGIVRIEFDNYTFAGEICSFALIFIMFYGGFSTSWKEARSVAMRSILLSSLGVFITAGLIALFSYKIIGMNLYESFLMGSVISSTDAASVFFILRSRKLNLKYNTASLLELESGSNDPCSYMITVVSISLIKGGVSGNGILYMIFSQIAYGVIGGFLIAYISSWIMRNAYIGDSGYIDVFLIGTAIFAYSIISVIGGNGYLAAYIVGIVLGNTGDYQKKTIVNFFDGLTGIMQILIFFLLGLLSFPSRLPSVFFEGLAIALFLSFVARPLAVFILMTPFKSGIRQQMTVSLAGLRGAASIVFAIMAVTKVDTEYDIFHIVFFIVLFSILFQGTLLPYVSKALGMIDMEGDVMKTFTDYTEETPMEFIKCRVRDNHDWNGKKLKDIILPPESLVVLIIRNGEKIIPGGDTEIKSGDYMVLSAFSTGNIDGVELKEINVDEDSIYCGKTISEIPMKSNNLIIIIKRSDKTIIPHGNTVISKGDILVLNRVWKKGKNE